MYPESGEGWIIFRPTSDTSHYCQFLSIILLIYLRPPSHPKHSPSDVSYTSAKTVIRITFPRNFQFRASTWRFQLLFLYVDLLF